MYVYQPQKILTEGKMPIYDFKCLDCGKVSEITISINAQAPPCPVCDSNKMKKLMPTSFTVFSDSRPAKKNSQTDAAQEGTNQIDPFGFAPR
jgi:putative FmdB family regulatory protein